ncbi:hypothetical protein [Sphingomonas sp.]|uniref:hypothetical protein n=1 Tax=Sphingomonas sp. TaxID=28214 RepID=UPI00286BA22B|nr:hypothetical protein [Sphingomonas sp.]
MVADFLDTNVLTSLLEQDATIVAAALLARCETLWSEDIQDGLVVEQQVTIRNPF